MSLPLSGEPAHGPLTGPEPRPGVSSFVPMSNRYSTRQAGSGSIGLGKPSSAVLLTDRWDWEGATLARTADILACRLDLDGLSHAFVDLRVWKSIGALLLQFSAVRDKI